MAMTETETEKAYETFFRDFQDENGDFKYVNKINQMIIENQRSLIIQYDDLIQMDGISVDSELADTLLNEPRRMINIGGQILKETIKVEDPDFYRKNSENKFFVRFDGIPEETEIRDIRAMDVQNQKIYWLEGMIIRATEIKSIVDKAFFECEIDPIHSQDIDFEDGYYREPSECDVCGNRKMYFKPEKSTMVDWQFITLQERPEDLPAGASPKSIPCQLKEDIVNSVRPGDRVKIGGIIRFKPKTAKKGELLSYDSWVEVNFIESLTKDDEIDELSEREREEFIEMARNPNFFNSLVSSLAPQIYGLREIKQAALLMLFGGVDKKEEGFSTRGQPNVLLVGDPGVAKSQLLKYVQSIAPRGLFTSGKGSSAAGLTAAIVRDTDTGDITLEAGAMVLADRGICLIDEFDKMSENDRSAIHEAMEQQTVSVAKAGIFATLNARTGVFAAANPKYGRYEDQRSFSENVNLTPAILSRFDLVFILKDKPNEENDSILAAHILQQHIENIEDTPQNRLMDEEKLKKYIKFASNNFKPILTNEATEKIRDFYVQMRNRYGGNMNNGEGSVTITARQLEGIIRLAEAKAKASLKKEVSKEHAQFAIDLMEYSLKEIAIDPETGTLDIDALYSGQTRSRRNRFAIIQSLIDELHRENNGEFSKTELIERAKNMENIPEDYTNEMIEQMKKDGVLYNPSRDTLNKP